MQPSRLPLPISDNPAVNALERALRDDVGVLAGLGNAEPLAQYLAAGLRDLAGRGVALPGQVFVWGADAFPMPRTIMHYLRSHDAIEVNRDHPHMSGTPDQIAKRMAGLHADGIFSTPDPYHLLLHELGHRVHWHTAPLRLALLDVVDAAGWPAWPAADAYLRRSIERTVSRYGATGPLEFVAEVYAMAMTGIAVPAELLRLYQGYRQEVEP